MKAFWKQIIVNNILKEKNQDIINEPVNSFQLAKGYRELKITLVHYFKDLILILLGVFPHHSASKDF